MSVRVYGNPCPFGVGLSEVSYETLSSYGLKGKGVAVMHLFGDELWRSGGGLVPNDGFALSYIYRLEGAFMNIIILFSSKVL